jgi:hypothetical protein
MKHVSFGGALYLLIGQKERKISVLRTQLRSAVKNECSEMNCLKKCLFIHCCIKYMKCL